MHTGPMPDSAGVFGDEKLSDEPCPKGEGHQVYCASWESSCGGYEDYRYRCSTCGHKWWVEGIDS